MSEITTEHRGYAIRYSENEDVWRCHELDMEELTLSQLKNKMNRYFAKIAKAGEGVHALVCSYGPSRFEPCLIVSIAAKGKSAWVSKAEERLIGIGHKRREMINRRSKVELDRLASTSAETVAAIEAHDAVLNEIQRLQRISKEMFDAIPRIDVSSIPRGGEDD